MCDHSVQRQFSINAEWLMFCVLVNAAREANLSHLIFFYQFSYLICALEAVLFSQWASHLLLFCQKCYIKDTRTYNYLLLWNVLHILLGELKIFLLKECLPLTWLHYFNIKSSQKKMKTKKPLKNFSEWFKFFLIILIIIHINNASAKHVSTFLHLFVGIIILWILKYLNVLLSSNNLHFQKK